MNYIDQITDKIMFKQFSLTNNGTPIKITVAENSAVGNQEELEVGAFTPIISGRLEISTNITYRGSNNGTVMVKIYNDNKIVANHDQTIAPGVNNNINIECDVIACRKYNVVASTSFSEADVKATVKVSGYIIDKATEYIIT